MAFVECELLNEEGVEKEEKYVDNVENFIDKMHLFCKLRISTGDR